MEVKLKRNKYYSTVTWVCSNSNFSSKESVFQHSSCSAALRRVVGVHIGKRSGKKWSTQIRLYFLPECTQPKSPMRKGSHLVAESPTGGFCLGSLCWSLLWSGPTRFQRGPLSVTAAPTTPPRCPRPTAPAKFCIPLPAAAPELKASLRGPTPRGPCPACCPPPHPLPWREDTQGRVLRQEALQRHRSPGRLPHGPRAPRPRRKGRVNGRHAHTEQPIRVGSAAPHFRSSLS